MTRADSASRNVLISGGAGFIGLHLARLLHAQGHRVVLIDNLQRNNGQLDADLEAFVTKPGVGFYYRSLLERDAFHGVNVNDGPFDDVYHLAAVNGTKKFYDAPDEVLRTNTLSLVYLLDWVATLPKRPRLMFTSSNEAYAGALAAFDQLPIPTPEDVPLVIEDTSNPRWSYGGSKLIGELFVIHYAKRHEIPSVIVRPHNFYGPRAGRNHVIPQLIARIDAKTDPFQLYSPDETRSFCYIQDAVEAMAGLMPCASVDARTVHIGSTEETRIGDLAELMFRIGGWKPTLIDALPSPSGSVERRLADVGRIKLLTGWKAKTSLEDGLRQTFSWYRANPKS